MSDPKRLPKLSLPAWRVVMQMDQNSTTLPGNLHIRFDQSGHILQADLPTSNAIPSVPAGPANDFDLLGQPVEAGDSRAGAIERLHGESQSINLWPLPAVARPDSAH